LRKHDPLGKNRPGGEKGTFQNSKNGSLKGGKRAAPVIRTQGRFLKGCGSLKKKVKGHARERNPINAMGVENFHGGLTTGRNPWRAA